MNLDFCIWFNRTNKFFQSFQVDMVRHAKSDSKQKVRTNLGIS